MAFKNYANGNPYFKNYTRCLRNSLTSCWKNLETLIGCQYALSVEWLDLLLEELACCGTVQVVVLVKQSPCPNVHQVVCLAGGRSKTEKYTEVILSHFVEFIIVKYEVFDGQESPSGEAATTVVGVNYQLLEVMLMK